MSKKILVIGAGSVGKRHAGNLKSLGATVASCDSRSDRLDEIKKVHGITETYLDLDGALKENSFDAAVVATPPHLHVPIAQKLIEQGLPVLIEKPIAAGPDGVADMLKLADKKGKFVLVGYTYRFWPPLIKIKELLDQKAIGAVYSARIIFSEYLPDWHPWEDYRTFYMAKHEQGGGALLDESHTLDFARWLFGDAQEVMAFNGKVSSLEITSDDLAEMVVRFASGVVGSIHMDIFGRAHRKDLEILGEKGNIYWNFYDNQVRVYSPEKKIWESHSFTSERNSMFSDEASHFLDCLAGRASPKVSGWDGLKTLELILAAQESSRTKRGVRLS